MSNPFAKYAGNPAGYLDALIASMETPFIDGVTFPGLPPEELQRQIHGTSNADALRGAVKFARVVRDKVKGFMPGSRLVDFGAGWGRMTRAFMPHFELENIIGLEPNSEFCRIARDLNPYLAFLQSPVEPPCDLLADRSVDYIVAYSVFSHLPEGLAGAWIAEFARIVKPGGAICITTWGEGFLDDVERDPNAFPYRKAIAAQLNVGEARERFRAGEFIYLGKPESHYGTAVVSEAALRRLLPRGIEIETVDKKSLAQTLLILRVDPLTARLEPA
jgi:SAM-dependent methyltransferase